ncbi:MAG: GNAT family N-acetyltransferase [Chloroflexi bacterium]|nr:MAG: GNAT family N-acetyltransferase [Chloroflexota bacterium]
MPSSVRRLGAHDAGAVDRLLQSDPVVNVYLRSELRLGGLDHGERGTAGPGPWWGLDDAGELRAVVAGGPLVVPWAPRRGDVETLAATLARQARPRMIVGLRDQVLALHAAWQPALQAREIRDPQPLLVLRRDALCLEAAAEVRRAARTDLDRLVVAAAHMHREEMGIDPLTLDPSGWRGRMGLLIERGWSWVWVQGDDIVFKAELSAWTPESVQVQGVWTAPLLRGRGLATAGLAAVCREVLSTTAACQLYVNHYNAPALAVYRRLGFEQLADYATVIY